MLPAEGNSMNRLMLLICVSGSSMLLTAADAPGPVVYMDASKVTEALAKTGLITSNTEYMVAGAHRDKPGGMMVISTLNRNWKSFALAIVGAEYVLRWLPRGTPEWNKFVTPDEPAQ